MRRLLIPATAQPVNPPHEPRQLLYEVSLSSNIRSFIRHKVIPAPPLWFARLPDASTLREERMTSPIQLFQRNSQWSMFTFSQPSRLTAPSSIGLPACSNTIPRRTRSCNPSTSSSFDRVVTSILGCRSVGL